jgi:ABC-type Fe3+-hydroxamate transport system substrate-binding protein
MPEESLMFFLMFLFALAPQRIVSVAPSITEILFALGAGNQIVGVTTYCNYPEAAKAKPKVGGYTTPSLEAILALRPDQVIMMKNRPDIGQKLRQTGIDVLELQPENLAGVYNAIQMISERIGVPERGRTLIQSIRKDLQDVAEKTNGPKAKVLFIVGRTPGTVSGLIGVGRGSYISELMGLAGAENILADAAVPYPQINMEEVIRKNPDIIIDMGHNEMVTESQKQAVKQLWKKYRFLRAVQRDAVFPISADYFVTPGPRVVQAVRDIRKMVDRGR